MNMRASNLIHCLTLDVVFDGSSEDSLVRADWLRAALLPVIDEVLRLHAQGGRARRIAALELDLGRVSREQAPAELARRLFAQLSAALGWSPEQASAASVVDERERTAGEHLLDFLRTGQLAWSVAGDLHLAHRQLLRQVLASSQAEQVLRTALGETRMLTRLIRQFDAGELLAVARVLYLSRPELHALFAQAEQELRVQPATEHRWRQLLLQAGAAPHITAAAHTAASTVPLLPGHAGLQNDAAEMLKFAMPPPQAGSDEAMSDVTLPRQSPWNGARDSSKARLPADIVTYQTSATAPLKPGETLALAIEQGDIAELQRMWPEIVTAQRAQFLQVWQQLSLDMQRRYLADFSRQFSPVQQAELAQMLVSSMPASPAVDHAVLGQMADGSQALALAMEQGDVVELQRRWTEIVTSQRAQFLQVWQQLPHDTKRHHLLTFSRQLNLTQQSELAQILTSSIPVSSVMGNAVLADGAKTPVSADTDIHQAAITAPIAPNEALALAIE